MGDFRLEIEIEIETGQKIETEMHRDPEMRG